MVLVQIAGDIAGVKHFQAYGEWYLHTSDFFGSPCGIKITICSVYRALFSIYRRGTIYYYSLIQDSKDIG